MQTPPRRKLPKRNRKFKKSLKNQFNHFGGNRQAAPKWDKFQKCHKEQTPHIEQQSKENIIQDEKEREVSPEQTVQIKESKSEIEEESEKEEKLDKQEIKKAPIKGNVKWEKEKNQLEAQQETTKNLTGWVTT